MKPAAFAYHDPTTVEEALELLGELGDDARPLAGGQSLVPMMNFRLARPATLVDLNRISELSYIDVAPDGALRIGAMTRQRALEHSSPIASGWALIGEASGHVGHAQIRNRGTIGGSLAHADPAAELPAVAVALEAQLMVRSRAAERTVTAEEFFLGEYTTSLDATELLVEVRFPPLPPRTGWAFQEVSRRYGDFALAGVAALVTLDDAGLVSRARLALTGVGPAPARPREAEAVVVGQRPNDALFAEAADIAGRAIDPVTDVLASASYRRQVAGVLVRRALAEASARAQGLAA